MSIVKIYYTRTHENKPLVVLDGGPFIDFECTPERLRAVASVLEEIAATSERRPTTGRYWKSEREVCEI